MGVFNGLKALKAWQMATLAVVLATGAIISYGVYVWASPGGGALGKDQQLIPAAYGDLVNQVSTSGSLVFPNRQALTFGAQGTVGEVLVAEGQKVEKGQPLARLDAATISSLEKSVAQARVSLRSAEDALAQAKSPPNLALDLAKAEAAVASARLTVKSAQDSLDRLLTPTAQDVAKAEAAVVNASLLVKSAQDSFDRLLKPTAQDIAQAEAAVASARLSLEKAREDRDTVKAGPTRDDLAKARATVDSAATGLVNARADLVLARKDWDSKLQTAREAADTANKGYRDAFQKWFGSGLVAEEVGLAPETILASWGADLPSLFGSRFQRIGLGVPQEPPPDNPQTRWSETVVYTWANLFPGELLATCDDGALLPARTVCVQRELNDSWKTLGQAQDNLEATGTQASKAIASAQAAITRAEETLENAQKAMADLEAGPDPLQVDVKEKQLALAQAALAKAEEDLTRLTSQVDPLEVQSRQKQLALAKANLAQAEEDLRLLTSKDNLLELESRQKQVAVAQASLARAQEDLARVQAGTDPLDIALKQTEVASAQQALEAAFQRLDGATLRAPFAGTVSAVNVEADQSVMASTSALEVVDPTVVELQGTVDEIDVLFVREGALADVTMDALPGQVLEGTVSVISTAARSQQGVVSYPISIRLQVPSSVQLREGLSASARIVIREERNALRVPIQALYGTYDSPVVRVMGNNGIEERPVVLGNSDDYWVVIRDGLKEGDRVVMQSATVTTGQLGGAMFRQATQFSGMGGIMPGGTFQTGGTRGTGQQQRQQQQQQRSR
ncbi:MAG: efflux RND transporter periplasmic adaptor subunit [Chloroflexi bacterium]|nr:efflux RND transporter periplasmic adaptor subunit [Chloroflexota bacterium]